MRKIITLQELKKIRPSFLSQKKIVVAGGCFDILHLGHLHFLQKAKKEGDILMIFLESDKKVKVLKGKNRPFFSQKERAEILAALTCVDYVLILPFLTEDKDYEKILQIIKPKIIALTENDPLKEKKRKQAQNLGSQLKIISFLPSFSTSKIAEILQRVEK